MPVVTSIQALTDPLAVTAGNSNCGVDWVRLRAFIKGAGGFAQPVYFISKDMLTGNSLASSLFSAYTTPFGNPVNGAPPIAVDGVGNVYMGWFGGTGGGLTKVDGNTLAQTSTGGAGTGPPLGFAAIADTTLCNIEVDSTEFFMTAGIGGTFATSRQYGALNQCVYAGRSGTYAPTVASGSAKGTTGKLGSGIGFLVSGPSSIASAQDFYFDKMTFANGGTWTPADWPTQNSAITHATIRIFAPTDFDATWTEAYCKGICCDQTDGNPIIWMSQANTALPGVMVKLDQNTGAILWSAVMPAAGSGAGNQFNYSLITRQRLYVVTFQTFTTIDTSDGSLTTTTAGMDGVSPLGAQCSNDAIGAVLLTGNFTGGADSPALLNSTPASFGGWALLYVDTVPPIPPGNRRFLSQCGPVRTGAPSSSPIIPPTPPPPPPPPVVVTNITTLAGEPLITLSGSNIITDT